MCAMFQRKMTDKPKNHFLPLSFPFYDNENYSIHVTKFNRKHLARPEFVSLPCKMPIV